MKILPISLFLLVMLLVSCHHPQHEKIETALQNSSSGYLFIIGGGEHDDTLMQQMIDVSQWKKGELITVITLPSTWGDSAFIWINDQLRQMTGQPCVKFDSAAVHDKKKLDSLSQSKIIFIGGGDQSRMMKLIEGGEVKKIIQEAYRHGATIGGTSAGAAAMSERMITGNQLLDTTYESTFPRLRSGNLELTEGLGLLDSVIVDMHFIARSRYNRLFSAIMEHPKFQCIGIDEATALIVHGDSATVAGESEVMVMENPDHVEKGEHHLMGARDIHVSVFMPGEKFRIKR